MSIIENATLPVAGWGECRAPDGAFAPSETFSPDLRVRIKQQHWNKGLGREECPAPQATRLLPSQGQPA